MEYWIFSTPWLVHYMDAQLHATGEDLYKTTPGLRSAHQYVAHATLPGGEFNFDFGDIYAGPITRARKGDDYERERIDGHFRTNYNLLYNLANRYGSGEAQGVANWLKAKGQVNAEEFWTFIWYNPSIKAVTIERQPKWHYFPDHELVYWRSSWADDATAFAFKAGPPEGHATTEKLKIFPDWRLSSGHAHPDAGSFIIWSGGKYLTGDSGYAGVPMTEHHNSVVFGGMGQGSEGKGHDAFSEMSYEQLNGIRIRDLKMSLKGVSLVADLAPAYRSDLGVSRFARRFAFTAPGKFEVEDTIETTREQVITWYLHSDSSIVKQGATYQFESGKPTLIAQMIANTAFDAAIGPNILTAPGKPGSVDKGEREERGVRLALTTTQPRKQANLHMYLDIKP
jgi:hypothetical protein